MYLSMSVRRMANLFSYPFFLFEIDRIQTLAIGEHRGTGSTNGVNVYEVGGRFFLLLPCTP
jgi:hypothetical protein